MPLAQSAGGGSFWFPVQASEVAEGHDFVFFFIMVVCAIFFVAIIGTTGYFVFKYRKRSGHKEERTSTHNTRLEIAWSLGPLVLLMVMFGMSTYWYMQMVSPPVATDAVEVKAIAKKWDWQFVYKKDGKQFKCKNMHVVKGRSVEVTCISTDVLHSLFFAPMRVKQDVVPGRYSRVFFTPQELSPPPKEYDGEWNEEIKSVYGSVENMPSADLGGWMIYCTEYCGDKHSLMRARLYVYETEEEMWANIEKEGDISKLSGVELGERIFDDNCQSCHSKNSNDEKWEKPGPNWGNILDEREFANGDTFKPKTKQELLDYVTRSIRKPNEQLVMSPDGVQGGGMPPFGENDTTTEQVEALVEFMLTLTDKKIGE
jgi:cytochrome c oxidase subunit 2